MTKKDTMKLYTYGSLILFLGLVLFFGQSGSRGATGFIPVISFNGEDVREITFSGVDHPGVYLSQEDKQWVIFREGETFTARSSRVEDFLRILGDLSPIRIASNSGSRPEFGLEDRAIGVTLVLESGVEHTYLFGNPTALGNEYFFQIAGSPIVQVVSGQVGFYLNQTATYWTDLRFWPEGFLRENILSMRLEGFDSPVREFQRDSDISGRTIWRSIHNNGEVDDRAAALINTIGSMEFFTRISVQDFSRLRGPDAVPYGIITLRSVGGVQSIVEFYAQDNDFAVQVITPGSQPLTGIVQTWRVEGFIE